MNCVDSAVAELLHLKSDSRLTSPMKDQIRRLLSGLRFLELYEQCLIKWNEALQGKKNRHLGSVRNPHIKATLQGATKGLYNIGIHALETQNFRDWDALVSDLFKRIQRCKPKVKEDCLELLDRSFQCRFSSFELQKFFRSLSDSLDEIIGKEMAMDSDIKMQVRGIKEKLHFFAQIFELSRKIRRSNKDLKDFITRSQAWAYNAACLSLLYWVFDEHQSQEPPIRMRIFLPTPEVNAMFLAVLKYLWSISHNRLLMDEGVPRFVDFVFEILQLVPLKDEVDDLHRELIFVTTFLIDPPMAEDYRKDAESIASEVHALFFSLSANKFEVETVKKRNTLLQTFLQKMNIIKAEVRKLYAQIFQDSSSFDFPRINVLGFLHSLLENLDEVSFQFANQQIVMLREDLLSLRPFLRDMLQSQNQHAELKDIRRQIVNVVYRIEIAINLLLCRNESVWYDMRWVSKQKDEIELIRSELRNQAYDLRVPDQEMRSRSPILPLRIDTPKLDAVGFEDEATTIINELIGGSRSLAIISIMGMAGQGKTTLADIVYKDPKVVEHFNIRAWCTVSHIYKRRSLMLDILSCIREQDSDIYLKDDNVLEMHLHRCLKDKSYLIVLDDIWDMSAWHDLQHSLSQKAKGSRILITSRCELQASNYYTSNIITHRVRPLSYRESWELLQQRLFPDGDCPSKFTEVGQRVAKICSGLPLAVVSAADLLSKDVDNLDWWREIAETLDSRIADEGVMESVELSYNNLPEHLKSCFLYFGALQQDKVIKARRLIQLWISEGFVHKSYLKSPEDVAEQYLRDLVSRSLLFVTKRSINGGIKECLIGSLFYELCLKKAKEEQFLRVESGEDLFFNSKCALYKNYRVCIQSGGDGFFASNPSGPCVHSLLFVPDYTCLNKGDLFSICNFKLLQVLDLEDMEFNGYFPEEVTLLVLLRYLAIWCPVGILAIPASISNLRRLETFRVKRVARFGDEIRTPQSLWTIKRLRHVDVGAFTASFSSDSDEEPPALADIQSLSAPSLCYGEDADKLLRKIVKVRKLRCQFQDSWDPYLKQNRFPKLEVLSQIRSLNVQYAGSLFYPSAIDFPTTLKKLTLAKFKLPWSEISTIGKLPRLQILKLLEDAFDGETWEVEDLEFRSLRFLEIRELNFAQWIIDDDVHDGFPLLQQMIVENCEKLEEIPSLFAGIPTLKKIQVRWCKPSVADSVRLIKETQLYWCNEEFEAHIRDVMI